VTLVVPRHPSGAWNGGLLLKSIPHLELQPASSTTKILEDPQNIESILMHNA
jgi:hypothetical protein